MFFWIIFFVLLLCFTPELFALLAEIVVTIVLIYLFINYWEIVLVIFVIFLIIGIFSKNKKI